MNLNREFRKQWILDCSYFKNNFKDFFYLNLSDHQINKFRKAENHKLIIY